MAKQAFRVTYATMKADDENLQQAYDEGIETAKSWLGQKHPFYVNGEAREGENWFEERSPIDRDVVIGQFAQASRQDVQDRASRVQHMQVGELERDQTGHGPARDHQQSQPALGPPPPGHQSGGRVGDADPLEQPYLDIGRVTCERERDRAAGEGESDGGHRPETRGARRAHEIQGRNLRCRGSRHLDRSFPPPVASE